MQERNGDARGRRRLAGRTRTAWLERLIAASLLALAVVVFVSQRYMIETVDRSRTWSAASIELRVELTEIRLRLEEALPGNRSAAVSRQVFADIDGAQARCRALMGGGRTDAGRVERLPAGEARSAAAMACGEITSLRAIAAARLRADSEDLARAFDRSVQRAIQSSRRASIAADRHVQGRHARAGRLNGATTVSLVLLLAGVVVLVRRHQRRVRRLARHNASILDAAGEGIYGLDPDGRTTFINPAAARMTGHDAEELLGQPVHDAVHHSRPDGTPYPVQECPVLVSLQDGTVHRCDEDVYWRKDGSSFPVDYISTPIIEDGTVTGAVVVFRDITERKQTEELLERQRRRLAEAEMVGGFGSFEWDVGADTAAWSDGLCRIYGLEPGQHPASFGAAAELTHPEDRALMRDAVREALQAGEEIDVEYRIAQPDGALRVLHCRGRVVTGDDGDRRIVGTAQDITGRREVERAKDEFVSVVSHELRTPLTSIRGALGLLAGGVLTSSPERAARMLQIALDSSDRLVRLINDILDVERIESGTIEMHPERCEAAELIERALEGVGHLAATASVTLSIRAEPVALAADPDRVVQALTNLVSNAIKFSPEGASVRVSCERRDGKALFAVRDRGRGIPEDKLESIFERFQQVDSSDSREKGGTGLGLAICRSIVEQHGGRIWVDSVVGDGSTFYFELPAARDDPPAASAPQEPGRPRILVCDDDRGVREVVGEMLEQRGYDVITVSTGGEAVKRALAQRPDAILLDLLMPGLSGWETAVELSRAPETREIPIVILSVLSPDEAEEAPVAVADWIEKPLDEKTLFGALDRAFAERRTVARVLVVEDDQDLAAVLVELFERHGLKTVHASSGAEAIELCRNVTPDLLILDLGLPEGDGFWVTDWLHQHERMRSVPIVVYTARDLGADERRRLDIGHTHFAIKGAVTIEQFERDVLKLVDALAPRPATADDDS